MRVYMSILNRIFGNRGKTSKAKILRKLEKQLLLNISSKENQF